jgi:16S rRNA processing protein RimM
VVARFLKPHGTNGVILAEVLTDEPGAVFVTGRRLWQVDEEGRAEGEPLVLRRGRAFKRGWLLEFEGLAARSAVEARKLNWLGALRAELHAPGPDAMYLHELIGAEVVAQGVRLGSVRELARVPGNTLLVVEGEGREHMIPFRAPFVRALDRAGRRVIVNLPPGLLEL